MEPDLERKKEIPAPPPLKEAQTEAVRIYEAKREKEVPPEFLEKEEVAPPKKEEKEKLEKVLASAGPPPKEKVSGEVARIKTIPPQKQIEHLVNLAFEKDPLLAVETARRLGDAFVLDSLHDLLAKDELYEKLIQAQKL